MKRILVTGGAGFIGANLIRFLQEDFVEITVIDNLMTGNSSNLEGLDVESIIADICEYDFDKLERYDEIYHLACAASPVAYQKKPIHTMDTCYVGTKKILEFASRHNSKILFASTSEIYGDPLISPQGEEYTGNVSSLSRRACYDEGKRVAETLCSEYHRAGLDARVARIFNTYGPYMSPYDGRVVSNFICQSLLNMPLTICGNGEQTRSFCYVSDTVRGLNELMSVSAEELFVVNIGNDDEKTILDIGKRILELQGKEEEFEFIKLPEADPKKRKPCLKKADRILNWKPVIDLDDGLKLTIEYFKKHLINRKSQDKMHEGVPLGLT